MSVGTPNGDASVHSLAGDRRAEGLVAPYARERLVRARAVEL